MIQLRIVAALSVVALAAAAAAAPQAQAQVAAGATVSRSWLGYGLHAPYGYGVHGFGWLGAWGPCGGLACVDDPYLRRAIRRELEQYEYRRELEERSRRSFATDATSPYSARRDWPPPTPQDQLQPAYRHSGEVRPEFSGAGHPRQEPDRPLR